MIRLTYGVLPTQEQFRDAFLLTSPDDLFKFVNDKRVGNVELTCAELWTELVKARDEWNADFVNESFAAEVGAAGDWCSSVLQVLGIEWV